MRVGIISVFSDHHRQGLPYRGLAQPLIGPVIASLLPDDVEVDVVNDTWEDPDFSRDYDLLFLSCMHPDFDRARQISHYWRRRGARTVLGGVMATTFPHLCAPWFDTVVVGDPETTVPDIVADFGAGRLKPRYVARPFEPAQLKRPRVELMAHKAIVPITCETSRGCPFTCDFCALTAVGTRFHPRPPEAVVAEIEAIRAALGDRLPWSLRNFVMFYDNNIGGNPRHLVKLCDALSRLGVRWGACITYNIVRDRELVDILSRGGCRALYVGVESFNPAAIADMNKRQNVVDDVRRTVDHCRRRGIYMSTGFLISPALDDVGYIESLPRRLAESGIQVPEFITFETAFPGTPYFNRVARGETAPFLPGVNLRDLNGYMLTQRPAQASPADYVAAYRATLQKVYSRRNKMIKLAADLPRFAAGGHVTPMMLVVRNMASLIFTPFANRTYLPGTEREPPETVPFTAADFDSEAQMRAMCEPTPVSDAAGRVLPMWLTGAPAFRRGGKEVRSPAPVGAHRMAPVDWLPVAAG